MSTLWNPKRPLNQPPNFGRVQAREDRPKSTAAHIAKSMHLEAQFARWEQTQKFGMRAKVN